jgi:RNA polymerase sigma factor (sigma-70 family)
MPQALQHLDGREPDGVVVEPILFARRLLRAQSDASLVELAAAGHERPFEVIVERYRRPLERYCARFVAPTLVEDVVQQVFLAAWLALRHGTEVRHLRGWLYRIAYNAALEVARSPEADCMPLRDGDRYADGADSVLERRLTTREALAALATLPERQRDALLRIAIDSRSPAEVADELGLTRNALRQLVFRARCTLRAGACALSPPQLAAWAASLGQGGGAGAAATAAGGGALVKVGAAVVLAGAVAVSTAEVVAPPGRGPERGAAAEARAAPGRPAAAGTAGPAAVVRDSIAPPVRLQRAQRERPAHGGRRQREGSPARSVQAVPGGVPASTEGDKHAPVTDDVEGVAADVDETKPEPEAVEGSAGGEVEGDADAAPSEPQTSDPGEETSHAGDAESPAPVPAEGQPEPEDEREAGDRAREGQP